MKQFLFESNTLTIICEGSNITVNLTDDERMKLIEAVQSGQPQGKAARKWLEELPEPYRSEALEAVQLFPLTPNFNCETLSGDVRYAFWFDDSPQGYDYWDNLCTQLENESK